MRPRATSAASPSAMTRPAVAERARTRSIPTVRQAFADSIGADIFDGGAPG